MDYEDLKPHELWLREQQKCHNTKKYLVGIQPTSPKLHIGNYLGCIQPGLEKQYDGNKVIFMIADRHAITTLSSQEVIENSAKMELQLRALGCEDIVYQSTFNNILYIFQQLLCLTNMGTLERMPQFKDKKDKVEYNMGLLTYPLLMAADIFHFNPDCVLIGEDQIAHMELANDMIARLRSVDCADGLKYKYEYELSPYPRIMSLMEPDKKMSKSLGDKHVLYLEDDYKKKIKSANANDEGLSNLKKIADGLGLSTDFVYNIDLKEAIWKRMQKLFGEFSSRT